MRVMKHTGNCYFLIFLTDRFIPMSDRYGLYFENVRRAIVGGLEKNQSVIGMDDQLYLPDECHVVPAEIYDVS